MLASVMVPVVASVLMFPGCWGTRPSPVCPFCSPSADHFSREVAEADFVLFGTFTNARKDPNDPGLNNGTTDLTVEQVIKGHDSVKGKKVITIPRYIPPDPKAPNEKYVVFFKLSDGKPDAFRGVAIPAESKFLDYLKRAIGPRPNSCLRG